MLGQYWQRFKFLIVNIQYDNILVGKPMNYDNDLQACAWAGVHSYLGQWEVIAALLSHVVSKTTGNIIIVEVSGRNHEWMDYESIDNSMNECMNENDRFDIRQGLKLKYIYVLAVENTEGCWSGIQSFHRQPLSNSSHSGFIQKPFFPVLLGIVVLYY